MRALGLDIGSVRIGVAVSDPAGSVASPLAVLDAREHGLGVTTMAVLYEDLTGRVPVEHVGDQWAVSLPLDGPGTRGFYSLAKRLMDVVVAVLGVGVLVAVGGPIAVAIRRSSPGPVL